jgi:hypothetical protein
VTEPSTIALTAAQRGRLLAGCLPAVGFALLAGGGTFLAAIFLDWQPPIVVVVLIVGITAFLLRDAVHRVRDIASGVAVVDEDTLELCSEAGNRYTCRFHRLGTFTTSQSVHTNVLPRVRYRLTYSPASQVLWTAEAITRGRSTWFPDRR